VLAVYTGDALGALTAVSGACNDDAGGSQSRVTFRAEAGVAYRVQVGGYREASGALIVDFGVPLPPAADVFPGVPVAALPAHLTAGTDDATTDPGEPAPPCAAGSSRTVWYTLTPATAMTLDIATAGSGFDTVLAVYTGDAPGALTAVPGACNDDSGGTRQSRVSFRAAAHTAYRVQAGGYGSASGELVVDFSSPDAPPPPPPSPSPSAAPSPSPPPVPSPSSLPSPSPSPSATPSPSRVLMYAPTVGGTVVADPPGPLYPVGATVRLTATPSAGQLFLGWTIDGAPHGWASPLVLAMDADHTVVAAFALRPAFADVPAGDPAAEALAQLAARGIIRGYGDGRVGPGDPVARAQLAALLCRALGWAGEDRGNPFVDRGAVDDELWRNVGTLAFYGVAHGYGAQIFAPTDDVLGAQALSLITRAMVATGAWRYQPDDPALFPAVPPASGHRIDLATYVHYAGLPPDLGAAAPFADWDRPAARAWFARALWQALDRASGTDRQP
jgi:hypothetical protein